MRRMNVLKIIVELLLVFSLLLPMTSCRNNINGKNANRITSDTPWFNGEIIDVDLCLDPQRTVGGIYPKLAGTDDNNIVVFADGDYVVEDWSKINKNSDYAIKNILMIDRETKQLKKKIDLYGILDSTDWPENAIYSDGRLIIKCESWESSTNTYFLRNYYIDPENEKIVETHDYELDNNIQYSGTYDIGEYRVETLFSIGREKKHCPLKVYSPDGGVRNVDISISGKDVFEVPVIFALDDNTALIPAATEREYVFFKLDLVSCTLSNVNSSDYEWLDVDRLLHPFNGSDGNVFFTTQQGVSMVNVKNKNVETIFDYSCCGVNRNYLKNLEIADCSEDDILLCGPYRTSNMFTSKFVMNYAIVEFTKADKNPHAGKQIMELYTPDGQVDEILSDAIIKYNNASDRYFIQLSDRYSRRDYLDYSNVSSLDDYDSAQLTANVKLSNDLAVDLMNGEGPDILLNTSDLGQLNNDNYLVDLSAYTADLDSNKYFTNIINCAESDGKLYQLPVSFTIEGIQTDPEYAGKTSIGFTTEEYNRFLYDTLNGEDVIESGQPLYFVKLFNGMSDKFIVNGNVDISSSDFADIAGYVKDNVQQNSLSWDIKPEDDVELVDFTTKGNKTAYYCNCPGISGYLVKRAQIKNGTAILGIPSSDGRGPMFGTDISVAVSAHAVNVDACVEFVKMLISDDIQYELVMSDKFVLNREAFKTGCNAAIEYFNTEEGSQNMFDYAAGTYVASHMKFTSEDIDNLESIILSCSKMNSADSAINAILIEEMPAYFLGQKDLSAVVAIIQDRVQKVLDERG